MTINKEELIHKAIYSVADLQSATPDVDQIADFLFDTVKPPISRELFKAGFLNSMGDEKILFQSFFEGVISDINNLISEVENSGASVSLCSWTQGNIFLQTRKAEVFQKYIEQKYLASPSIYASLNKVPLIPSIINDLKKQGCDFIVIMDDRLENVLAVKNELKGVSENIKIIHKIRPDKKTIHRLTHLDELIDECAEWKEVTECIKEHGTFKKLGLILDKDGVVCNSTVYRKQLETHLVNFIKEFLTVPANQ
jgi:hypothetical protein